MLDSNRFPLLASATWRRTQGYVGEDLSARSTVASMHKGCDILQRVNFEIIGDRVGTMPGVDRHRFRHWALGGLQCLMVRHDAPAATLEECERILQLLADYPCLDDERYSQAQSEAIEEAWDSWGRSELTQAIYQECASPEDPRDMPDAAIDALWRAWLEENGRTIEHGDEISFPVEDAAKDIAATLDARFEAETQRLAESRVAEYHRHQLCLPGIEAMPDPEGLRDATRAERYGYSDHVGG